MLRRRIAILIASSYRWASSKIRMIMGSTALPITAPAEEAESKRAIITRRYATAVNRPTTESYVTRSILQGRFADPNTYDSAQGISLRGIINKCKAVAYSVIEAPGNGAVRMVMRRLTNAVAAIAEVTSSFRRIVTGSVAIGDVADVLEISVSKMTAIGVEANADAADGREGESFKFVTTGRISGAIGADAASSEKASGIQNGVYSDGAFWIEPYYEDGMLVIRQAFSIIETADRLEVH